nr:retrotransposon protein, putative, unclassified [Tanacetum cinerariifolium]
MLDTSYGEETIEELTIVVMLTAQIQPDLVQFLGHVIDRNGVHIDPAKIEAIKNWAAPTTPTEKDKKHERGKEEGKLCSALILALPEGPEDFVVYCDALLKGYGAMLISTVCWSEVGDSQLIGPKLIRETIKKIVQIKNRLISAHSHQKSYADKISKPLEFEVGDMNHKKCLAKGDNVIFIDEIQLDGKLHMIEELVEIVNREREDQIKKKNPHPFTKNKPNVAGSGPEWLFDIDLLTKSLNYEPVFVGNQSNGDADVNAGDQPKDVNAGDIQGDVDEISRNDDEQIIRDPNLNTQTRRMINFFVETAMVIHALKDPSWIEVMQEKLLQFKLQDVWTLVDLPYGKRAIGSKWVFRNKLDERDGCKECLPYGTINEEVYVMHPLGFQDPEFLAKVYNVEKAMGTIDQTLFIRRQRGDFILVQVYVDDIIFGSSNP